MQSTTYRDAVNRFLPEFEKDRALDMAREKDISIDHSEIGEEKERDGYYPNELDEEMQGYHYGDKVIPQYNYWNRGWDWRYRNRKYNKIYSQYSNKYYSGRHWNKYTGWGFKESHPKIGPEYDPNSHFVNPYYDYDYKDDRTYWARMR